jgi:hypothetical protein
MVQALPEPVRREYEALAADSLVFYPRQLVAADGPGYDRLVEALRRDELPWATELDLAGLRMQEVERIDDDYVSLRFPVGRYAAKLQKLRARARRKHGDKSGQELALKLQVNTMYGVLASPHLPVNNAVAANAITATARAQAFAMTLALNGYQVVTDGCTYRLDQVPACTFAECLRRQPDYPLRRPDGGGSIPFLDPGSIPQDDEGFTHWYRRHVAWFFGVQGPEHERLFGMHRLEHKHTGDTGLVSFDALACDGAGNYLKCTAAAGGGWEVAEAAMRGYGPESRATLQEWILATYPGDDMRTLPPVAEDRVLLHLKEAMRKARQALAGGSEAVVLPLGMPDRRVRSYRAVRPSAFVFQTPEQYRAVTKQVDKFTRRHGCGLEVLTLRRDYRNHRRGSLSCLAEAVYDHIQAGGEDLTKHLNLNRPFAGLADVVEERQNELDRRREEAGEALLDLIDVARLDEDATAASIVVTPDLRHLVD